MGWGEVGLHKYGLASNWPLPHSFWVKHSWSHSLDSYTPSLVSGAISASSILCGSFRRAMGLAGTRYQEIAVSISLAFWWVSPPLHCEPHWIGGSTLISDRACTQLWHGPLGPSVTQLDVRRASLDHANASGLFPMFPRGISWELGEILFLEVSDSISSTSKTLFSVWQLLLGHQSGKVGEGVSSVTVGDTPLQLSLGPPSAVNIFVCLMSFHLLPGCQHQAHPGCVLWPPMPPWGQLQFGIFPA